MSRLEKNMEESLKESFIIDTSAFLSLEVVDLLEESLHYFTFITTSSVLLELEQFAIYDDFLGKVARRVLDSKNKFVVKDIHMKDQIARLGKTDTELCTLARIESLPLVTDDCKLNNHVTTIVNVYFSTVFLIIFVEAAILTKKLALEKLEFLQSARNWNKNIIYLWTKEALEKL